MGKDRKIVTQALKRFKLGAMNFQKKGKWLLAGDKLGFYGDRQSMKDGLDLDKEEDEDEGRKKTSS